MNLLINYPTKKISQNRKVNNLANKGMALEEMINRSNEYYKENDIAFITKRPTPIKVLKTDGNYKITDAVFLSASTLDNVGVFQGHYLDFEAKETSSKIGFPLSNLAQHQLESIELVIKHKGYSFVLVYLKAFEEIYLLDGNFILKAAQSNQKMIPIQDIRTHGIQVKQGYSILLDYIKAVKIAYFEK